MDLLELVDDIGANRDPLANGCLELGHHSTGSVITRGIKGAPRSRTCLVEALQRYLGEVSYS